MTAPVKVPLKIYQGSTFTEVFRWESNTKVYKAITNVTKAAPCVLTVTLHGAPVGWRVKVSNVLGMKEINSEDYYTVTTASSNNITFNAVNAVGFSDYISGGILEYNEPMSLASTTARMQIRSKPSSTEVLLSLTTENSMIALDDTNKTITISIPAASTELLTFKSAVYSLELINGTTVTPFIYGNITLDNEITR